MQSWADHLYHFYLSLKPPKNLPDGIEWLYPQKDQQVRAVLKLFLQKYYSDKKPRTLLLGINPGRYGAGVTGVNFTAPRQLSDNLQIPHPFKMRSELSAEFMYSMIEAFGGPGAFYSRYFIGSVCPFGFVQQGKNLNYYDQRELLNAVEPFIITAMNRLLKGNFTTERCYCIGGEKNFRYLTKLNSEQCWFTKIIPLAHPRFIMQYKRKQVSDFITLYIGNLKN